MLADVRTTALSVANKKSIELLTPPEEDIVYAAIRKSNQFCTCSWGKGNPLQAIIVNILVFATLVVLVTALAIQAALQISRDISVQTINDVALKSQVDGNIICADHRFEPIFRDNVLANLKAFEYK